MLKSACVLGGMNVDITGTPQGALRLADSNPGQVRVTPGGVGRNMAENLARMGFRVELIAPLGNDGFAALLQGACEAAGVGLAHAPRLPLPSSVYLCLMDGQGDMHAAINDMALCEAITADMLDMAALNAFDGVLLDANLPAPVLARAAREATAPLIADPVSAAKAPRLLPLLPRLHAIKPNRMEAQTLTGEADPAQAARALCRMGVGRAFVSAGPLGVFYCGEGKEGLLPPLPTPLVNATGAGDSATAAIAAGCLLGLDVEQTARLACQVAALTLQSPSAVSPALSPDVLHSFYE